MENVITKTGYATKVKWLIAILAIALLSCSRVVLVPEYSAGIEAQIINGAMLNDKIYIDLADADPAQRQYKNFSERYSTVEAEINSIALKNEIRKNNADMLAIISKLKTAFAKYRDDHKRNNTQICRRHRW